MKIGHPTGPGQRLNNHAWKRSYTGAGVYVNLPGAKESLKVAVPYEAKDSLTRETGRTFEISPGEGLILHFLRTELA